MAIIKTSLLLLSCAGWMLWGRDKAPKYIRLEFIPSLFCAYTSIIMLCAGLLNILPLCSYLYFISGLFLFFKHAHIYKQEFLFIPAFGLSLIYMYFHLDGNIILHYDDLNFWGTVVKVMLANDRLPNFQDTFLYHTSYPLGSSLFIYYFCRLTNSSDSMMMWSQQFMQLSFLFSLTASINRKNALPATIGFFSYLIFATVSLISPYELLVDSLLPIAAVSTIHMIHFFKTKPYTALFCALPMFTLLLTIKNSGFFFFSISLLFLIYYSHDYFKEHIHLSFLLCIPVAIFYIWNRHVDYAFSPTSISRHNISPSHLLSVYSQKSYSEIFYIISSYISKLLQIKYLRILIIFAIYYIITLIIFRKTIHILSLPSLLSKRLFVFIGIYLTYQLGTLAMYIFSMPLTEALALASFDRYCRTIEIFCLGLLYCFIQEDSQYYSRFSMLIGTCFLLIPLTLCANNIELIFTNNRHINNRALIRLHFEELKSLTNLEAGNSILLYQPLTKDYYLTKVLQYEFLTSNIRRVNTPDDFEKHAKKYDYWIIWEDHDSLMDSDYLNNLAPVCSNNHYIYFNPE